MKGFVPIKDSVPEMYEGKLEEWRDWKENMEDYVDTVKGGMKEIMREVEKEEGKIDEDWKKDKGDMAVKSDIHLWRLLKQKTRGEAKKVVLTVGEGEGLAAWRALCRSMGPRGQVSVARKRSYIRPRCRAAPAGPSPYNLHRALLRPTGL